MSAIRCKTILCANAAAAAAHGVILTADDLSAYPELSTRMQAAAEQFAAAIHQIQVELLQQSQPRPPGEEPPGVIDPTEPAPR
jgi:hypothetical protein